MPTPAVRRITTTVPATVHARLQAAAERRGVDLAAIAADILNAAASVDAATGPVGRSADDCRHRHSQPEPKLPPLRRCLDCQAVFVG